MTDKYFDNEPSSRHSILPQTEVSEESLGVGLYVRTAEFERHLIHISHRYKNIAITWLLASFTAIGFLLSVEVKNLPFNPLEAVFLVALPSGLGNTLLWHLDINIYSKFWAAVFIEQVRLERRYPFLVANKGLTLSVDAEREKIGSHAILYMVINVVQIATLTAVAFVLLKDHPFWMGGAGVVFIALLVITLWGMVRVSRKIRRGFNQLIHSL